MKIFLLMPWSFVAVAFSHKMHFEVLLLLLFLFLLLLLLFLFLMPLLLLVNSLAVDTNSMTPFFAFVGFQTRYYESRF